MKKAARDLFPRKRRMVCQNTSFAVLKSSLNLFPNFFQALSLDSLTFVAAGLRASEYCERSSNSSSSNSVFYFRTVNTIKEYGKSKGIKRGTGKEK